MLGWWFLGKLGRGLSGGGSWRSCLYLLLGRYELSKGRQNKPALIRELWPPSQYLLHLSKNYRSLLKCMKRACLPRQCTWICRPSMVPSLAHISLNSFSFALIVSTSLPVFIVKTIFFGDTATCWHRISIFRAATLVGTRTENHHCGSLSKVLEMSA